MTSLPPSKRFSCFRFAKDVCPDQTRGQPPPKVAPKPTAPPADAPAPEPAAPQRYHAVLSDEDVRAWRRLYHFIDLDDSGFISKGEIDAKMTKMLGPFKWEDKDHDGKMDFDDFLDCMENLSPMQRHTALVWAKRECPESGHTVNSTKYYSR